MMPIRLISLQVTVINFLLSFFFAMPVYANTKSRGPLNITNNFPTTLLFFNYTPEDTITTKKKEFIIRFGITESNTIVEDKKEDAEVIIDNELTRYHLNAFTGVTDNFEAGIEIPLLHYHKGFMDTPIEWVEDRLGKSSRARKKTRRNDIRFLIVDQEDTIYDIDHETVGLGDITLKFKYSLVKNYRKYFNVSIKFDLKLPTGDKKKMLGSGGVDFGPALLLRKSYENFYFQLHFGYFRFTELKIEKYMTIRTSNFFHGIFSIEYAMEKVSWLVQFAANSNPFERLNIEDVNSGGQAIAVGFKYSFMRRWLFQFSLMENISSVAFPDFSTDIGIEYRF